MFDQADCFLNVSREFLVCTTVHKARNLPVFNADTYVRVSLGKSVKNTKIFHKSENPYYNEYFAFEVSCTLAELLRLTMVYEVKKRTCCKTPITLGELLIDLHTIWDQPHKSFYKKWGKLERSSDSGSPTSHVSGYIQVDLAIVSPDQPAFAIPVGPADADDIESNLLQSLRLPACNIRYQISFYSGFFAKKADYLLEVSFAGVNGKTKVCKGTNNPEWRERIQFDWTYPSLSQTFILQVMCHEGLTWKCVAESETFLDEISFNATPSLGPTFIHFYDSQDYVGRVLMEISTEKLKTWGDTIGRLISVRPITYFSPKDWWTEEMFILEFLTWEGGFVHSNASNMKICMTLAEYKSNSLECHLKNYASHSSALKYFNQSAPFKAIHITSSLPDYRTKYEADHFLFTLAKQMRSEMENFKLFQLKYPQEVRMHRKCLKSIILTILDLVKDSQRRFQYNGFKKHTTWDENRLAFLRGFFSKLTSNLKELRQNLKTMGKGASVGDEVFHELEQLRGQIESIMQTRTQDEWPDLQLHMCLGSGKAATKKFATCKLNAQHFIFSQRSECTGPWYGVPRNFVFKDTNCQHTCRNCGCLSGVVYGWLRIAAESEQNDFSFSIAWEQKERFYYQPKVEASHVICRVYVHQAKIRPGADNTGLCDARLRVFFGEQMLETSTIDKSLAPVWNETLAFAVHRMPGPISWYQRYPPLLFVELFDEDKLKADDYMGCGLVELSLSNHSLHRPQIVSSAESISSDPQEEVAEFSSRFQGKGAVLTLKRFVKSQVALEKFEELRSASPPLLKWMPIAHMGTSRIEILMSGELLQVDEGEIRDRGHAVLLESIPKAIQPSMAKFLMELTFIGLRNCQKMSFFSLGRYRIHVMMGELLLKSGISGTRLKESINFLENFASGIVTLPKQFQYWPPTIATLVDYPGNKREVSLGATLISDPSKYLSKEDSPCDMDEIESSIIQVQGHDENVPLLPERSSLKKSLYRQLRDILPRLVANRATRKESTPRPAIDDADYTWWTKFYNSMYMQEQHIEASTKHNLTIYGWELEKEADFSFLTDWGESFHLIHGVKIKKDKPPKEEVYATLKMHIKLSPCSCDSGSSVTLSTALNRISSKIQSLHTMNEEFNVMVRVYLVQGMNFRSHDARSQSDSYVKLQLGNQVISDRANYICNQSNPIYGKMFQLPATIPREHILKISVYDRGGASDDLIGSTDIDLEDRVRSKHRATVGIANEFNRSGYNAWRDVMTPLQILKDVCRKNNLGPPNFVGNTVEVDGVVFEDASTILNVVDDVQERLSLRVLKNLQSLPRIGYRIVPEHVETRSLYRTDRPGVEQGKLQLWVEIFDSDNVPPPIDITPAPPRMYELRVVVYNCADVTFQERNLFGTNMSDIYIKGWCEEDETPQKTDVHYRSLTGEGSFNWRMVFPLKYSPVEDMMFIRRKGGLFEKYETKQPPMLYLQIWEDDVLSADDFMGAMDLCLSHFPEPFDTKAACNERSIKKSRGFVNLFRKKTVRGWFPCKGPSAKDDYVIAGKLELELEILSDREAAAKPAGLGRSPPNALPPPNRPDTSFNPWKSPLKSMKHIVVPAIRRCLLCILLVALVAVVVYILFRDVVQKFIDEI